MFYVISYKSLINSNRFFDYKLKSSSYFHQTVSWLGAARLTLGADGDSGARAGEYIKPPENKINFYL